MPAFFISKHNYGKLNRSCPVFLKIVKNYVDRKIKGKNIESMLSYDPEIQAEMAAALEDE